MADVPAYRWNEHWRVKYTFPFCLCRRLQVASRIIAVMLGRLRMSIVDCRAAYETLSRQSFTPLHSKVNVVASAIGLWSADAAFDVKELEKSIRQVIKENLKHGESDPDFALLKEDDAIDQCSKACKV